MNKIYLMATGQSINNISDAGWEYLKSQYTIGISWFIKKGFETTHYYSHEYDSQPEEVAKTIHHNKWDTTLHLGIREHHLPHRFKDVRGPRLAYDKYKDIIKCKKYVFSHFINSFKGEAWLLGKETPYPIEKCWAKKNTDVLFGFRGTLMASLNLCYVLGYNEVVLCGVDLNNGLHFYKSELSKFEHKNFKKYNPSKDVHSTQMTLKGLRGVVDGLKLIVDTGLLSIKVANRSSLLCDYGFEFEELL